ncbi:MAG: AAA family ATPase, partial [Sulfolobales archaeon]
MFIERVYLKNILSHSESIVEFREGLNVIIGPNGAGKSTIIDSIVYALLGYGRGSEEIMRTKRKSDMIRVGASSGIISVGFRIGGRRYHVERRITLSGESEDVLDQISPVSQRLAVRSIVPREILKVLSISDPKILTSTIIARQDFLNEVLLETPAKRKERILELLGLDKLEKARERLREAEKELEKEKSKILESIGRKRLLEEEIKRLERDLTVLREEYSKLSPVLEDLKKKLENLERDREEVQDILRRIPVAQVYEMRSREYGEKRETLKRIREQLALYNKIDVKLLGVLRDEILSLSNSVKSLSSEYSVREKNLNEISLRLRSAVEEILNTYHLDKIRDLYRDENYTEIVKLLEESLDSLRRDISSLKAQIEIYRNFQTSFRETDRCPICGSPLSRERIEHLIREHSVKIEELSRRVEELERKKTRLGELVERLRENIERLRVEKERLREIEKQINDAKSRIKERIDLCKNLVESVFGKVESVSETYCIATLDKMLREYEVLKNQEKDLARDISSIERELEKLSEENREIRERVQRFIRDKSLKELFDKDLSYIESYLRGYRDQVSKAYEDAKRRYEETSGRVSRVEGEISGREKELVRKRDELNKLRDIELEREKIEKMISVVERLMEILKKDGLIAKILTSRVREALEAEINEILRETGREFRIKIDNEFGFTVVYASGVERPIENLSGGEKTILSIALRLALARVLTGRIPRFMILDEPTQNLDPDMRVMIFDIIKRISGAMDQVIVITHDEEIADRADRLIRVVNEGGVSRVI